MESAVRLHIWTPGSRTSRRIHNHRWNFTSRVLIGAVFEELFRAGPGADGWLYVYRSGDDSTYSLRLLGHTRVMSVATREWRPGNVYARNAEQLHRVAVDRKAIAATLVVCQPPERDSTKVVAESQTMNFDRIEEVALSPALTAELILRVARHIRPVEHG
jgi:hypothetical protein